MFQFEVTAWNPCLVAATFSPIMSAMSVLRAQRKGDAT